jgi:hypothetical protein
MAVFQIGDRYARLTIIGVLPKANPKAERRYEVRCDCGREKIVRGSNLRPGQTSGCGCGRGRRWAMKPDVAATKDHLLDALKAAHKRLAQEATP